MCGSCEKLCISHCSCLFVYKLTLVNQLSRLAKGEEKEPVKTVNSRLAVILDCWFWKTSCQWFGVHDLCVNCLLFPFGVLHVLLFSLCLLSFSSIWYPHGPSTPLWRIQLKCNVHASIPNFSHLEGSHFPLVFLCFDSSSTCVSHCGDVFFLLGYIHIAGNQNISFSLPPLAPQAPYRSYFSSLWSTR